MRFGLHIALTEDTVDPRDVARLAEAAGFESLFVPEHTHLPVTMASVHPSGADRHDRLRRFLDPFVALAMAAAVTERIRLGTGVCLVAQHDPIVLAKQVATLDRLSGGRVLFGVGAGWNREEMANHGVDPARRWAAMREHVLALTAIWTEERAEFHGRFVDFDPIWSWPKPVQRPRPPVIVGGEGPGVLRRVLDYGDEWGPNADPGIDARIPELQRLAAERGRAAIGVTAFHIAPDRDTLRRYARAGMTRAVFSLPSAPRAGVATAVERLADVIEAYTRD
jgi:probable F420-dependent oxidoreductase